MNPYELCPVDGFMRVYQQPGEHFQSVKVVKLQESSLVMIPPISRRHFTHDDVIKWKHFPRYWPFDRGIHRSPVNSPHIGQWRGALMFSLIYVWINGWVKNRKAGDLRRYRSHYDVTVMNDAKSAILLLDVPSNTARYIKIMQGTLM